MKHTTMDGFAYAEPTEFPGDVVCSLRPQIGPAGGQISVLDQWFDQNAGRGGQDGLTYRVSPPLEMPPSEMERSASVHTTPSTPVKRTRTRRGPGRPPKRGRPSKPKPDGRRATAAGPLTAPQRRDILDAVDFATDLDRDLNTPVDIHPAFLDAYPEGDLREWFRTGPWRAMAEFFARRKDEAGRPLGWYAFATRENYVGERREHLHIVCHCPACHREALEAMLRRRFPGDPRAIRVGTLEAEGITYRLKQSTGNAMGPPRPGRPTPETRSRHDGALVAPVQGKRYMVSRSVDLAARTHAGWQQDRDAWRAARRDYWRARRREAEDRGEAPAFG